MVGGYMTPLGLSLASSIRNSRCAELVSSCQIQLIRDWPWLSYRSLYRPIKKIADKYAEICGYRQHGLKYDDLIVEENETVQKALKRLTPREEYDRAYRLRVASQLSVLHHPLPKEQQLTQQQVSTRPSVSWDQRVKPALAASERPKEGREAPLTALAGLSTALARSQLYTLYFLHHSSIRYSLADTTTFSRRLIYRTSATSPRSSQRL